LQTSNSDTIGKPLVQTFDTITGQISLAWDDAINSGTVRPGRYGYPGNDHNELVITR